MGVVYKARHVGLKRLVAVKMIRAGADAGEAERARFRTEAEAVARLQHPHIVQLYELGEVAGQPYFCLEFVGGPSLARRLDGNPLPPAEATRLVETLAQAVEYAHAQGVLHRDLKPANILLAVGQAFQPDSSRPQDVRLESLTYVPKVTDFGLAKQLGEDAGQTQSGAILGTPSYMAPEQAAGRVKDVGPWTDVYALGAILYECLTGRPPFRAASVLDTLEQVRTQHPVPVRRLQPKVPRDLETVCLKCLEKDPRRRYPTAGELADDLGRFLRGEPTRARPLGPVGRAWRWSRRHPLAAGAAAAAAAAALLAAVVYWNTRPAYLDVRVTPGSAQVLLDGEPLRVTDGRAFGPHRPGRHRLVVRADGYQEQEQQVVLVRGGDNRVRVNVELTTLTGYLRQTSDPPEAEVEVVNDRGEICARGLTPFDSPRLPSGAYTLRLRKEMYLPVEIPVTVPAEGRVAEGKIIELKGDPRFGESPQFFQALKKLSEPVDFPGMGEDATLFEFLELAAGRYGLTIDVNEAALKSAGRGDVARARFGKALPPLRGVSLKTLLQLVLARYPGELAYLPRPGGQGRGGFVLEVTTPEAARETPLTILYPVKDLVGAAGAAPLVNAIRQSVGSPADWAPGAASIGYHLDLKAVQLRGPFSVQEGTVKYLTELRATRAGGQQPQP
jgi:hypothetical protein